MEKETLHFRIGLSGTYWGRPPRYSVLVNDTAVVDSVLVDVPSDEIFYVEFDLDSDVEDNVLQIRLENKTADDVKKDQYTDPDNFTIIGDMLLNIATVEIDEIDLGHLIYSLSEYHVDRPVEYNGETTQIIKNCVNLGWNGEWQFAWTNPFYIFLLENI
jgi:hypothetical protein